MEIVGRGGVGGVIVIVFLGLGVFFYSLEGFIVTVLFWWTLFYLVSSSKVGVFSGFFLFEVGVGVRFKGFLGWKKENLSVFGRGVRFFTFCFDFDFVVFFIWV